MAAEKTSRQKVEALYKLGKGKSAAEIAAELEMSPANVYAHIRKINAENGIASRGRGRPPKVQTEGKAEAPKAARPAPGKAAAPKSAPKSAPAPATASSNGHDKSQYPKVLAAIDEELADARKNVSRLEKMREVLVG